MDKPKNMQTRFYFDPTLVKGIPIILGIGLLLMVAGGLLVTGPSIRHVVFLAVSGGPLFLFWLGFSRGSYITLDGQNVYGTVLFIRGRLTQISDIVFIRRNPTFAGLMSEVIMGVRKKDGAITERGLANKHGLTEGDFKKLIETIHSINPNIKIDQDLFRK